MQGLLRGLGTALLVTNLFTAVLRLAWYCIILTPYILVCLQQFHSANGLMECSTERSHIFKEG